MFAPDVVQRLAQLFRGLTRAHGRYVLAPRKSKTNGNGATEEKVKGTATTVREPVTLELWQRHVEGQTGLGIVPVTDEGRCYFGAIDVDKYPIDHAEIERKVRALNVPLIPIRSKSGGCHLVCFTDSNGASAAIMIATLKEWAGYLGFADCEIFPKQVELKDEHDVGNWINMPYFNAAHTDRYAIYKGAPLDLTQFLERALQLQIDEASLADYDALHPPQHSEDFAEGPPCLQTLSLAGPFPAGSRNNALTAVAVYLKKAHPDDWVVRLRAYRDKYAPTQTDKDLADMVRSYSKKDYNYQCNQQPIRSVCNRAQCVKRKFGVGATPQCDIDIHNAVMVRAQPPYFQLTVNGRRVTVGIADLMYWMRFVQVCAQQEIGIAAQIAHGKWMEMVAIIVNESQKIAPPSDETPYGRFADLWHDFATTTPEAETIEEMYTGGKRFMKEGEIIFRLEPFIKYAKARGFNALELSNSQVLHAALEELGIKSQQMRIGDKVVRVRVGRVDVVLSGVLPVKRIEEGM